ncbi:hypothetical protein BJ878DRAFT_69184 [Calycina marina]|uniref:C2H2-type domain-containing protein n=1 Tax=Calycina marina TaxID=1763456 RepID=A0A9P8CET4_9HELO|nr:hypothetical protein BJ878DRAFT_69184 [Calycina marina]
MPPNRDEHGIDRNLSYQTLERAENEDYIPELESPLAEYPPQRYQYYLACPFAKHNRQRYQAVSNACTERWGYADIGRLIEHIKRDHSLEFGCSRCKKRFSTATKSTIEIVKNNHNCNPRDLNAEDPEWMDDKQESNLKDWKCKGSSKLDDSGKWSLVYRCLFPDDYIIPSAYYDYMYPSHLSTTPTTADSLFNQQQYNHSVRADPSILTPRQVPTAYHDTTKDYMGTTEADAAAFNVNDGQHNDGYAYKWSIPQGTDSGYVSLPTQYSNEDDTQRDSVQPLHEALYGIGGVAAQDCPFLYSEEHEDLESGL